MARIELSQKTLSKLWVAIQLKDDTLEDNELIIDIDYTKKNVIVSNKLTQKAFDLNCRDRRLIFKYFEK